MHVIFDLDGTLVDTLPDIAQAYNKALRKLGRQTHSVEDYKAKIGWGLRRTAQLAMPSGSSSEEIDLLVRTAQEYYTSNPCLKSRVFEGISEVLQYLESQNSSISVLTNKNEDIARRIIVECFPKVSFFEVLGSRGSRPLKPNPKSLVELVLKEGSTSPIIYVGDSLVDAQTAQAANIEFVGVGWGYGFHSQVPDNLAICMNHNELLSILAVHVERRT